LEDTVVQHFGQHAGAAMLRWRTRSSSISASTPVAIRDRSLPTQFTTHGRLAIAGRDNACRVMFGVAESARGIGQLATDWNRRADSAVSGMRMRSRR
jgi:hypothetical protein